MNFSSIREYFYRMYNACYLLLLLPLGIFIFLYYQLQQKKITPIVDNALSVLLLTGGAILICVVNLTTVHWVSLRRLKAYATVPGLGQKLDRYYEIIFLRFAGGATSSLVMAIGLILTGSEYFAILFLMIMVVMALQWPTAARACRALRLKGDEYTMVFNKTEKL